MIFIVDFDNLVSDWKGSKRNDLEYVIDKIIERIDNNILSDKNQISFKLYGGWFSGIRMTKNAQRISTIIQSSFPKVTILTLDDLSIKRIKITVEIVTSLIYRPNYHLHNTLRRRGVSFLKKSKPPKDMGCNKADCSLEKIRQVFISEVCPNNGCPVKIDDMVNLQEQKQVDTMMCVDLLELKGTSDLVGVISSDDDLYPAVLRLVDSGTSVLHLSGKTNKNWDFNNLSRNSGKYIFAQI